MGGGETREGAGAVVDGHAFGHEHVHLAFCLEGKDTFWVSLYRFHLVSNASPQHRIATEDASIDGWKSLWCLPVPTFRGEDNDEILEALALSLAESDPTVLPIAPST